MRFIDDSKGVPATPKPWPLRVLLHLVLLMTALTGPAIIVFSFFVPRTDFWIPFPIGIVISLVMVPFGLGLSRWELHEHRQTLRLRERGIPAAAEILAMRLASYGDDTGLALTLRFSGDGVTPFEAVYTCAEDRTLDVGARLEAIVDPSINLYAIPNRR
jgi:hypothetical protein